MRIFPSRRFAALAVLDCAAWALGLLFGTVVRYDFDLSRVDLHGLITIIPIAAGVQLVTGLVCGLYTGRWRFGSFDEVAAVAGASMIAAVIVMDIDVWGRSPHWVPASGVLGASVAALVAMAGVRYLWRSAEEARRRPRGDTVARLLVFGAGDGATQVVTQMLRDPSSPYIPVALLDDDKRKRKLRIMGVPVVGDRSDLAGAASAYGADTLLIAIPSADSALVSELTDLGVDAGLAVKVLPPVTELFGGNVGIADIHDVTEADLLGRRAIETDLDAIAHYLTGKRVLVTGAGGSIGSELCRQIYRFAPSRLIMIDRDESALHGVQLSIEGRALLDSPDLVLLDIRDRAAVERTFAETQPEVVFHAAALKHLPLLERHAAEAVKTNVWGTLTLLDVATRSGVQRFVNISTDKAADPMSVLGYSKRVGERLTAYFAGTADGTYLSVRFGNVLGSRGSMLDTFRAQVDAGGPITVTDPNVTRYFMTVEEAVQLVIQAGAIGSDGEVLVLDMGQPVRIADVAHRLAATADRPIDVIYTGLRPGEKLHEVLFGAGESDRRPMHELISHVAVPPLAPDGALGLDAAAPDDDIVAALRALCDAPAFTA